MTLKTDVNFQAVLNHRLDGCDSYTLDLTVGCDHNCVYCHFSTYQKTIYKKKNRSYRGETIVLSIDDLLGMENLPDKIYLSYSTDPFAPKVREIAHKVIEHFLKNKVTVLIITKGIIPQKTIELLNLYGDQVSVEIGITNLSEERRRMIEPGTATALERLRMLSELAKTRISYLAARMDPMFPKIDDRDPDLEELLGRIAETGTKNVVASYIIASERTMQSLAQIPYLKESVTMLTEKTQTVAPHPLMTTPLSYKSERVAKMKEIGSKHGLIVHTCHCKDSRLKKTDQNYSCHPGDSSGFVKNEKNTNPVDYFKRAKDAC